MKLLQQGRFATPFCDRQSIFLAFEAVIEQTLTEFEQSAMLDFWQGSIETIGMRGPAEPSPEETMVRSMGWKVHTSIVTILLKIAGWSSWYETHRILARTPELEDAWLLVTDQLE